MRHTSFAATYLAACLLALGACGDDDGTSPTTHQLSFSGDASFQTPHSGQTVTVAVVRTSDGAVVGEQEGVVSDSADPAFSFTFPNVLTAGVAYEVHYFIDSNFGGGTAGVCDPPSTDHQWSVPVPSVSADVVIVESHDTGNLGDVCATFD